MKQNSLLIILIGTVSILILIWFGLNPSPTMHPEDEHQGQGEHDVEMPRGPHGGRVLSDGEFSLEMTIFERGVPPEFHIYAYEDEQPINPQELALTIKLRRLGDVVDHIRFTPQQDYLKGDQVIYEPHSFEVIVEAKYKNKIYQWQYDNFEGRTQIPAAMAKKMGIETETVGPVTMTETRTLTGLVHTDPNRLSRVRARFDGVVKSVKREMGDTVRRGDILATVQSNESLQTYKLRAPIDGLILHSDIQIGEATGDTPLFIIADLSQVWIELDVFNRDMQYIKTGQQVQIESFDGVTKRSGVIDWVSPLAAHASQSVNARIKLANQDGNFRPGQFVRGRVTVAEQQVEKAVRQSAIQRFRDFKVVFVRIGDTYEVRMLELGRSNNEWVEVLGGIKSAAEYVTQHSYLIKADIEKSGASHDH